MIELFNFICRGSQIHRRSSNYNNLLMSLTSAFMSNPDRLAAIKARLDHLFSRYDYHLYDRRRAPHPKLLLELGNLGCFGMMQPEAQGGLGLTEPEMMELFEHLGRYDFALSSFLGIHNSLFLYPIKEFACEHLVDFKAFVSGRKFGSFALTEVLNGSNPKLISGNAFYQSENDSFIINAKKIWIGGASWSSAILLFVKAENDNPVVNKGEILGFVLDSELKEIKFNGEFLTYGLNNVVQDYISVENLEIGLLNAFPLSGYEVAKAAMNNTRMVLSSICIGSISRALSLVADFQIYKFELGQSSHPSLVYEHELMKMKWSSLKSIFNEFRLHIQKSESKNEKEFFSLLTKVLISEIGSEIIDMCMQHFGGRGYSENYGLAKLDLDFRVARIFEGTSQTIYTHLGKCFQLYHDKWEKLTVINKYLIDEFKFDFLFHKPKSKDLKEVFSTLMGQVVSEFFICEKLEKVNLIRSQNKINSLIKEIINLHNIKIKMQISDIFISKVNFSGYGELTNFIDVDYKKFK